MTTRPRWLRPSAATRARLPSSLLVWHPTELPASFGSSRELVLASALSSTRAGDRGLVYRTTRDQGIVGVFDFLSDAHAHPDLRWAAFGILREITPFVPRDRLVTHPELRATFSTVRGHKSIPDGVAGARRGAAGTPPFTTAKVPLPSADEQWEWVPSRPETNWGSEAAMRDAIANDQQAWTKLGFPSRPLTERRPPGSNLRMDLYTDGVIGECKNVLSGLESLRQLDTYPELCSHSSSARWTGNIIVATGFTTELAQAVNRRQDVRLWTCQRDDRGQASLTQICRKG